MAGVANFDKTAVAMVLSLTSLLGVGALVADQAAARNNPAITVHVSVPQVCSTKG